MSPFQLPHHLYFSNQFYICVNFNFISACNNMIRDAAPNLATCLPFDHPTIHKTLNGRNSVVIPSPRSMSSLHLLIQANAGNSVVKQQSRRTCLPTLRSVFQSLLWPIKEYISKQQRRGYYQAVFQELVKFTHI